MQRERETEIHTLVQTFSLSLFPFFPQLQHTPVMPPTDTYTHHVQWSVMGLWINGQYFIEQPNCHQLITSPSDRHTLLDPVSFYLMGN